MTRKTPQEIEAMAKEAIPDPHPSENSASLAYLNAKLRHAYQEGYSSNTELSDFKKELVEKVEKLIEYAAKHKDFFGETMAEHILDLLTQEDQPEGGKEEKL
jgi:methyltransferase-like protein